VNEYTGKLTDERYPIVENSFKYGELVMGHVLTNGKEEPTPDGTWHIWRWCEPARSYAHVINIDCKDEMYLNLLVKRLWLQAKYNDKYGHSGYQKLMEQADIEHRQKIADDRQDLMGEIHKANSAMINRAMYNMEHGRTAATNPTKEVISSYSGQKNRSKIVRPLEDREGGLLLPEDM
jgi:hypothetical protein